MTQRLPILLLLLACTPAPRPAALRTEVYGRTTGTLAITGHRDADTPISIDARLRVKLDGTWLQTGDAPCAVDQGPALRCRLDDRTDVDITTAVVDDTRPDTGYTIQAEIKLNSGEPRRVEGIELLSTDANGLALADRADRVRYLHNGYQSWSFAGALDVLPGTPALPRDDDGSIKYRAPNGLFAADEFLGLSSHDAIIDVDDTTAFIVGFVSANQWQSAIALEWPAEGRRLTALNGFTGDSARLEVGKPVTSETLYVEYAPVTTTADAKGAMHRYGEQLEQRRDKRLDPNGGEPRFAQNGWFSWNRWFLDVTEPIVLRTADEMTPIAGANFDLVEVDDGWEKTWGDWTPNEKFGPIATLATTLESKQKRLGLWLAPFLVDASLPIVTEHPDWWVKQRDGTTPITHQPFGTNVPLRVIDTTHPDALAWAMANLTRLKADGCDFFKLDFLYAAAFDGVRHDAAATGVSALKTGLVAIANTIGNVRVNLCGAPWLHAALAPMSSIRIGGDVASGLGDYGFVFVAGAVRNLLARNFGPVSVRSDLDQFWLKKHTGAQLRTALTWMALTPRTFALADDFAELSTDQKAAISKSISLAAEFGAPALPMPPAPFFEAGRTHLSSPAIELLTDPELVQSVIPAVVTSGTFTIVTNWSDVPMTHTLVGSWKERWTDRTLTGDVTIDVHDTLVLDPLGSL